VKIDSIEVIFEKGRWSVDNSLEQFVHGLNGDIHDQAVGSATSAEDVFSELMLEYLSDAGVVENASAAKFEERIGRGIGRVSGYGINDDEDTLYFSPPSFLMPASLRDCRRTRYGRLSSRPSGTPRMR
jgi:hypothetical protein